MVTGSFMNFLRDERGGYTLWSLVWFMLYVAIGGLAVDGTDGYRTKTLLQATADSAALAAVMSVGVPGQDPVQRALDYATANADPAVHGTVLRDTEVYVGEWIFADERFTTNTTDPNAVYVITRRAQQNGNPVVLNALRILHLFGFENLWNVNTEAIAVKGIHKCHNNGHIAGTTLEYRPNTHFHNNICLIGHEGFFVAGASGGAQQDFDPGVYIGVGCESDERGCVGPGTGPFNNEEFNDAFDSTGDPVTGNYSDGTMPANAMRTDNYIAATITMAETYGNVNTFLTNYGQVGIDYTGLTFLGHPDTGAVSYVEVPSAEYPTLPAPADMVPYTVYNIDCNGRFELPEGTYENVGMIFDCPVDLDGNYEMGTSLLATTDTTGQCFGDCNNPQGPYAVEVQGPMTLGGSCDDGVLVLSQGSLHFAAQGNVTGTTILAQGNIFYAAQAQGPAGIHMEATGGIFQAAGPDQHWGLCEGTLTNGPKVLTYSLVR